MNTKKYDLVVKENEAARHLPYGDRKKIGGIYQTDRNNRSKRIGCGFIAWRGKVIVVGIRTKEKYCEGTITKFVLGHSIIHNDDTYDRDYGIHLAIKRAVKETKKVLYATTYTMLNDGFCQAITEHEATHIQNNLKHYYDEYK